MINTANAKAGNAGIINPNQSISIKARTARIEPRNVGNMLFLIKSGVEPNAKYQAHPTKMAQTGTWIVANIQANAAKIETETSIFSNFIVFRIPLYT